MGTKYLFLFVDALPYQSICYMPSLKKFACVRRVIPDLGFSANLYPALLAGQSADQLGVYNEFSLTVHKSKERTSWQSKSLWDRLLNSKAVAFLDVQRHKVPLFNLALHKIVGRLSRREIGNIPFRYLKYFVKRKPDVFNPIEFPQSILAMAPDMAVIRGDLEGGRPTERDEPVFQKALCLVEQGKSVFALFMDLDYIGHQYGVNHKEYIRYLLKLDSYIETLFEAFIKRHREHARIVLLSDHGMCEVKRHLSFYPEREFGTASPNKYLYFVDATMIRVWIYDQKLKNEICSFLREGSFGTILSPQAREQYHITDSSFGDFIVVADEGVMFIPNFYGARKKRGMHGYLPELESQHAVFASNVQDATHNTAGGNVVQGSTSVYRLLCALLDKS